MPSQPAITQTPLALATAAAEAAAEEAGDIFDDAERQHELLFKESRYPSAASCRWTPTSSTCSPASS